MAGGGLLFCLDSDKIFYKSYHISCRKYFQTYSGLMNSNNKKT